MSDYAACVSGSRSFCPNFCLEEVNIASTGPCWVWSTLKTTTVAVCRGKDRVGGSAAEKTVQALKPAAFASHFSVCTAALIVGRSMPDGTPRRWNFPDPPSSDSDESAECGKSLALVPAYFSAESRIPYPCLERVRPKESPGKTARASVRLKPRK